MQRTDGLEQSRSGHDAVHLTMQGSRWPLASASDACYRLASVDLAALTSRVHAVEAVA